MNTLQCGVIMILHYSDGREALIAAIGILHEKTNPSSLLKISTSHVLKKFFFLTGLLYSTI